MKKERVFIRSFEAGDHLETFLVTAVASILVIRIFLKLTGYPKLGGEKLHIAHVLWGGLLMAAAILILLIFLGKTRERLAVIVGGIGFGYFIDEVGKFLTHDNDYFFKPSVAVMYVVFILIFLSVRSIQSGRLHTQIEYLMNAVREMEALAYQNVDKDEKNKILFFLDRSPARHPLIPYLRRAVEQAEPVETKPVSLLKKIRASLAAHYRRIARTPWFRRGVIFFFSIQALLSFFYIVGLVFFKGLRWNQLMIIGVLNRILTRLENLSLVDWAELASSLLSGIFVILGIFFLTRNWLRALKMFERSVLISIFLTQVFVFYREEFGAIIGLAFNLLLLAALRFMMAKEKSSLQQQNICQGMRHEIR